MTEVSVAEYASRYGLSEQMVRRRVRAGVVPARKTGGVWLVDDEVRHRPPTRRPLADRAATALLSEIDSRAGSATLRSSERSRLHERVTRLADGSETEVADLLRDWFRPRARDPERLFVQPSDLPDLRADERVVPGGASDPRAEISAPDHLEAHVTEHDLADLRREYLLRRSGSPNVTLHVHERSPLRPVPLSQLVLDLIADGGPRERRQAVRLVQRALR